jgi:hypothetical protein
MFYLAEKFWGDDNRSEKMESTGNRKRRAEQARAQLVPRIFGHFKIVGTISGI